MHLQVAGSDVVLSDVRPVGLDDVVDAEVRVIIRLGVRECGDRPISTPATDGWS